MSSIYKANLSSGFASKVITPKKPVELGGYGYYLNRISTETYDDIYTKALFLKLKDNNVLLISNDLIGLSKDFTRSISREISERVDIQRENIIISCTHTHSAPATANLEGCGNIDKVYMQYLKKKIVENAIAATKSLCTTNLNFKRFDIESFSFNKSLPQRTKKRQDVLLLSFETPESKILLVQFSSHPSVLSNRSTSISKDFIKAFYSFAKENDFNDTIFFNGACGEILPTIVQKNASTKSTSDSYVSKVEFKQENELLKRKLLNQSRKSQWEKVKIDSIKVVNKNITLKFSVPSYYKDVKRMKKYFESIFYDKIDINKGLIKAHPEKKDPNVVRKEKRVKGIQKMISTRFKQFMRKLEQKNLEFSKKAEIVIIEIGDVLLVALPFEITNEFETSLRSFYPKLFVFCYTGGLGGYIYNPKESTSYPKTRGSLLYNLFPFEKESFNILLDTTKKLIKSYL